QVILDLVVVRPDLAEGLPEPRGREAVHRRIDLGDLLLSGRRVALLHDLLAPTPLTDDPPVTLGLGDDGAQHRRGGAALSMMVDQPPDRLDGQEGHVSRQDEDRSLTAFGPGLLDGVPASQTLLLDDRAD